jgi:phosphoribosylformylglycinamidine synthase I
MLFAVVVFPGSNCDHDVYHVAKHVLGCAARYVWHKDRDLRGADVVVLPGGFSYGDYLRTGAIARFSPIMEEVKRFASRGGHVAGFCNGFQILLEAGLLPGAMRRNESLKYVCRDVHLKVENAMTPWTRKYAKSEVVRIPIGHGDGNYYIDDEGLKMLEGEGRVAFRYVGEGGARGDPLANPNGSRNDIAGIISPRGNVIGMMPHPERLSEGVLGGEDGRRLFESIIEAIG